MGLLDLYHTGVRSCWPRGRRGRRRERRAYGPERRLKARFTHALHRRDRPDEDIDGTSTWRYAALS
jgi:hypothetical protein